MKKRRASLSMNGKRYGGKLFRLGSCCRRLIKTYTMNAETMPKKPTAKPKKGRPSRYTHALAERICAAVANGKSLNKAAGAEGVKWTTVRDWVQKHAAFSAMYARACEARLELLEGRMLELMERGHEVAMDAACAATRLNAVKLEMDNIKWILCKLLPRKYGEKAALELTGAEGSPLVPDLPEDRIAVIAAKVEEARSKIRLEEKSAPGG